MSYEFVTSEEKAAMTATMLTARGMGYEKFPLLDVQEAAQAILGVVDGGYPVGEWFTMLVKFALKCDQRNLRKLGKAFPAVATLLTIWRESGPEHLKVLADMKLEMVEVPDGD